jgi:hypothetical protein
MSQIDLLVQEVTRRIDVIDERLDWCDHCSEGHRINK